MGIVAAHVLKSPGDPGFRPGLLRWCFHPASDGMMMVEAAAAAVLCQGKWGSGPNYRRARERKWARAELFHSGSSLFFVQQQQQEDSEWGWKCSPGMALIYIVIYYSMYPFLREKTKSTARVVFRSITLPPDLFFFNSGPSRPPFQDHTSGSQPNPPTI